MGPLVERRLARLSEPARRLGWAAAVLGSELSLERAAGLLERPAPDLAGAWAELKAAQVLGEHGFSHGLVFEAALASIPTPARSLLHRRAAGVLERAGSSPAHIAEHWLAGDEPGRAAPRRGGAAGPGRLPARGGRRPLPPGGRAPRGRR